MIQKINIEYDVVAMTIKISENDFTNFEAFGILEAAKQMISHDWLKNVLDEEND